jgi:hypothetical protein
MSEKKHENSGLVASAKVRRKPRAAWAIAGLGLVLSACAGQESAQVEEDNAAVGEGAPAVEMVGQAVEQDETAGDPAAPGAAPGGGSAPGAGEKTVWVVMKDKPNLSAATSARGWKAKGRAVYQALSQQAQTSQAPLLSWLSAQQVQYKSFWAVNTVKVTADAATIAALEARPDVEKVVDDFQLQIAPPSRGSAKSVVQTVEWNIAEVGAPSAWSDFGTTGEGIVVGTIDTGVQFDHPALVNQYRGKQEDGSFVHDYNWYDPSNVCGFPSDTPCDNADHGTHTMGTIAGDDGGENQIGVAPGVRWMAAKGCEDFSCSFDALLSSGQWMLAPTDISGNNPDPDMRPHVVSNSWGGGGGDTFYMESRGDLPGLFQRQFRTLLRVFGVTRRLRAVVLRWRLRRERLDCVLLEPRPLFRRWHQAEHRGSRRRGAELGSWEPVRVLQRHLDGGASHRWRGRAVVVGSAGHPRRHRSDA